MEGDLKKQRIVSLPQAAGPVGLPRREEIFFSFSYSPCLLLEKMRKQMVGCDLYGRPLTLRLGGGKGLEWKKKIYIYIKNILLFLLFGSLNRREWKDHSFVWEFK